MTVASAFADEKYLCCRYASGNSLRIFSIARTDGVNSPGDDGGTILIRDWYGEILGDMFSSTERSGGVKFPYSESTVKMELVSKIPPPWKRWSHFALMSNTVVLLGLAGITIPALRGLLWAFG